MKLDVIELAKKCGFHENTAHTVLVFYNYAQYAPSTELQAIDTAAAQKEKK